VAGGECVARGCFDVQRDDFEERSMLFRCCFVAKDLGGVDSWRVWVFV